MTDIVERLKDAENATHALFNHIFQDAREEIERLRIEVSKQQALTEAAQQLAEVAQRRADALRTKVEAMERQEPIAKGK